MLKRVLTSANVAPSRSMSKNNCLAARLEAFDVPKSRRNQQVINYPVIIIRADYLSPLFKTTTREVSPCQFFTISRRVWLKLCE
jgi:hypothetical protein